VDLSEAGGYIEYRDKPKLQPLVGEISWSKKPGHAEKLARILDRLDASLSPADMNLPAYKLHKLIGKEEGVWSVWVNGNWRVTFQFERDNAVLIDYRDYH